VRFEEFGLERWLLKEAEIDLGGGWLWGISWRGWI
jgi:hypothetical protein